MQNTHISPRAQLALLHLTDSALPTGGFSHSLGMEDYLLRDIVTDPESYMGWLNAYIRQTAPTEGLLSRLATEMGLKARDGEADYDALAELDRMSHVCVLPVQIRNANQQMGKRMGRIIAQVVPEAEMALAYSAGMEDGTYYGAPPIAFGLAAGELGVDPETALRAFLMQLTTSINQNAIRGIPIGQDAGQRALYNSYEAIEDAVEATANMTLLDLGASAPGLELAQMAHETRLARMFMS